MRINTWWLIYIRVEPLYLQRYCNEHHVICVFIIDTCMWYIQRFKGPCLKRSYWSTMCYSGESWMINHSHFTTLFNTYIPHILSDYWLISSILSHFIYLLIFNVLKMVLFHIICHFVFIYEVRLKLSCTWNWFLCSIFVTVPPRIDRRFTWFGDDTKCLGVDITIHRSLSLAHWGRVTHICVSKLTSVGSDNGLSPGRRQAIIWTNAGILLIGPLGTNFSENLIEIHIFSCKKMHLKMSSGKWRPFCLGLNVLMFVSTPIPLVSLLSFG